MQTTMTADELRQVMGNERPPQLIDVRSPAEFASGHVPGAVNIPMEQVESRLDDIAVRAVLICQGGTRAAISASWLSQRREAVVLRGGTSAWQKAGYPLITCTPCRWSLERQVRLGAGLMVLTGTLLSVLLGKSWGYLAMFAGAGLTFAGLTDICGMGIVLARMPWNRTSKAIKGGAAAATNCCS
jgi:rhodanese-related sulfurtransferase